METTTVNKMRKTLCLIFIILLYPSMMTAQGVFAVNGFCIAAPDRNGVEKFVDFIENELAPAGINTLVLRVDFNYAYKSRPELQDENPLTELDVKKNCSFLQEKWNQLNSTS